MEREKGNLNINNVIKKNEETGQSKDKDWQDGTSSGEETSLSSCKEMAQVSA